MKQQEKGRCPWAKTDLYVAYHDHEWGVPVHDDRLLFEFLILEGAQAGLSWETILKKRESYREAFDQFNPEMIAKYGDKKHQSLLTNPGIIRNRLKIDAAIHNAKAFLAVQREFGTFDQYIWRFIGDEPKQNAWKSLKEVPAKTTESDAMSKDLKRRGFKFVGSTICYAFVQAVGMVNPAQSKLGPEAGSSDQGHDEERKIDDGPFEEKGRMIPLYRDPWFTFRFADDRLIPRFQLEGVEAGCRVEVFKIDPGTSKRLSLLVPATVGEGGWVDLQEPIIMRAGEGVIAVANKAGGDSINLA